jgi:hypothetical protein
MAYKSYKRNEELIHNNNNFNVILI